MIDNRVPPFGERSDVELLDEILRSELNPEEKARVVLAVRERQISRQQNKLLLLLTLVVATSTVIQAIGTVHMILVDTSRNPIGVTQTETADHPALVPHEEDVHEKNEHGETP